MARALRSSKTDAYMKEHSKMGFFMGLGNIIGGMGGCIKDNL